MRQLNVLLLGRFSGAGAVFLSLAVCLLPNSSIAQERPSFSRGLAQTIDAGLFRCRGFRSRVSAVGRISSSDGKQWTVPAKTHFREATKAADLYNPCNGIRPRRLSEINLKRLAVLDAGGTDIFTAYVFADNYFEFYVNGKLLAVDAVPFTPFNSSIIRFKAKRPFTIAIKAVDWEENLGLGSERSRGVGYHPGDGGLVAVIKDDGGKTVAVTDGTWRAQAFYIAPLQDRTCLKLRANVRDTADCSTRSVPDGRSFYAAHWRIPANWFAPGFNDRAWPLARTFTNETVGVDNKPAYMNFTSLFDDPQADAKFIWSSNLILDNVVLIRKKVD